MWFFLLLFVQNTPWQVPDTQIYKRLFSIHVARGDQGQWFFLDRQDQTVLLADSHGNIKATTGGKGEGPGYFQRPSKIVFTDGQLFIFDPPYIHRLDGDGNFLARLSYPSHLVLVERVTNGWVALSGLAYGYKDADLELIHFDDDFKHERTWFRWAPENERYDAKPLGDGEFWINPAEDYTALRSEPQGRYVYVKPAGLAAIFVFDSSDGKLVRKIKVPGPPLPFDREWGERYLAFQNNLGQGKIQFKPHFPDYFPVISQFYISVDPYLIVDKWSPPSQTDVFGESPRPIPSLVYQLNGEPVESPVSRIKGGNRIVGMDESWFYVIFTTEDEMYSIDRVARNDLATFLENHPLPPFSLEDF